MFVVKHRKIFYGISAVLLLASMLSMVVYGFNLSIDFKGGAILEVKYAAENPEVSVARPQSELIETALEPLDVGASIREIGADSYLIRMRSITEQERLAVLNAVNTIQAAEVVRFDSIGPVLGAEAKRNAIASVVMVLLAIVVFIAFAFRKISEPVSSWKYGIIAIIALLHDVIIPTGAFAALGHFRGYEIDTLFVTALLVILGFSVHDTIVVFDRVRENLKHDNKRKDFAQTVGDSIGQTFTRSINTSMTVILSLIVLYFVGGQATQQFTLALLIGIIAGTYSSIFIGSPLLVTLVQLQTKKKK